MILSRRQRESLLDEMTRMLANKQTVAFANHSKISERVSNGDLSFYINSPDKEFVIKYSNNTMKLNAKDKTFSELDALIFSNKNKITGITDTGQNSSTISLSAKWAYNKDAETLKRMKKYNPKGVSGSGVVEIIGITDENKYSQQHLLTYEYWKDNQEKQEEEEQQNYDERYAFKEHQHQQYADKQHLHEQYALKEELNTKADLTHLHEQYALKTELDSKADKLHQHSEYSLTTHQHPEYSLTTHQHSEYSLTTHQHSDYATKAELFLQLAGKSNSDHTHDGLWTKKQIVDLIDDETGTPWYEKLFKGLEVINEVAQDGYIYWLQSQINTIYGMLAANGITDAAQSISGLGAVVQGVASKFSNVANALDWVGEKFPKLQNTISKITTPLRNVANHISGYQKLIDNVVDTVDDMIELDDFAGQVAHHIDHVGTIDDLLRTELLPDTVDVATQGASTGAKVLEFGYKKNGYMLIPS